MNSRVLLIVGLVLLLAAGSAAWFGYQTTVEARQQMADAEAAVAEVKAQAAAEAANRLPVLIAVRDIKPFQSVTSEDFVVDHLSRAVPGAFTAADQVLGRFPQTDVPAGSLLDVSQFQPGGTVSRLLRPGERAVAIAVDEVVGGGGFVQPGDSVDVLMFVPGESRSSSSAQVVMRALRVVSFGDSLVTPAALAEPPVSGSATTPPSATPQTDGPTMPRPARTAILAVRETDMTRLMLASSVGVLRLAIRPADEGAAAGTELAAGRTSVRDNRLERAGNLAPLGPVAAQPVATAAVRAPASAPARSQPPANSIIIFRGLNRGDAP